MVVIHRVVKATTRKGKQILLKKEPQIVEPPKKVLFLNGRNTSEQTRLLAKDLFSLRKPLAMMLKKKNDVTIFEDATPVEKLCRKYEAPLFVLGSHSKKRPNNIVIGRMYNYTLLDMVELDLSAFEAIETFIGDKIALGMKPIILFHGPHWEDTAEYKHLQSLLMDLFHKENVEAIRLQGLEFVMSFTLNPLNKKIMIRSYKGQLKKSGVKNPRVELIEMGPRIDFKLRRSKLPSDDLMKEALRQPQESRPRKTKNISTDGLGVKHGRIHIGKQQIQTVKMRKMKGLKRTIHLKKLERAGKDLLAQSGNDAAPQNKNVNVVRNPPDAWRKKDSVLYSPV